MFRVTGFFMGLWMKWVVLFSSGNNICASQCGGGFLLRWVLCKDNKMEGGMANLILQGICGCLV